MDPGHPQQDHPRICLYGAQVQGEGAQCQVQGGEGRGDKEQAQGV